MITQPSDMAILDRNTTHNNINAPSPVSAKQAAEKMQPTEMRSPSNNAMQQRLQMLGAILHLAQNSALHRRYTIAELEEQFVPSLLHNQFRYYEIDGVPIGFINWAWLTEEIEAKYMTGEYELTLDEWVGGSSLWFPEFVAPYGHARKMIADLRTNVHQKGTPAKALRISSEGELMGVSQYRL